MAIKTQIEWDGKQHVGFVNLGTNIDDDSLPAATNALVFLLVPINSNWKIPVAYYLTNGLTDKVLANLTRNIFTHYTYTIMVFMCVFWSVMDVEEIRVCYQNLGFTWGTHSIHHLSHIQQTHPKVFTFSLTTAICLS